MLTSLPVSSNNAVRISQPESLHAVLFDVCTVDVMCHVSMILGWNQISPTTGSNIRCYVFGVLTTPASDRVSLTIRIIMVVITWMDSQLSSVSALANKPVAQGSSDPCCCSDITFILQKSKCLPSLEEPATAPRSFYRIA